MKNKTLLILLGAATLLMGFYWFQVRPSTSRAKCSNLNYSLSLYLKNVGVGSQEEVDKVISKGGLGFEVKNRAYRACLASFGIKPENLLK